jgi:alkylation response protein AidB-like acyl-CoA dehydrogenase
MEMLLTPEQEALQTSFRRLFANYCPPTLVRRYQAEQKAAVINELWTQLIATGLFGLGLPEEHGGFGDLFDLALVVMEAGRVLCPTVVYSTVAFGQAVLHLGTSAQHRQWLPGVARGELTGSVALWNPSDGSDVRSPLVATRYAGGWRLNGELQFVPNADRVQALLVSARTSGQSREPEQTFGFIVTPGAPGLKHERMQTMGRDSQCVVHFDDVPVEPSHVFGLEPLGIVDEQLHWVSNAVTALQTMEMMGGAQAVLERTVAYVIGRTQFDRPLASFQAVQHHVANMHVAIEGARLAAFQAAWWTSKGRLAEREVAIAKLKCSDAYKSATLTAHVLHGGMGYMREFDLHLWSERAKATELLGGPAATQIRRLERANQLIR